MDMMEDFELVRMLKRNRRRYRSGLPGTQGN